MYVIRRQHPIDYADAHIFRSLGDYRANPQAQLTLQHAIAVLRNPHQMIAVVKNRVASFAVLCHPVKIQASLRFNGMTEYMQACKQGLKPSPPEGGGFNQKK